MNKVQLKKVSKQRDILNVSGMAFGIWREHYKAIITTDQIEYMLERYQSPTAIEKAIADGYEYYYIVTRMGMHAGYVATKPNEPHGKMYISKLYLLPEHRGKGLAYDTVRQLQKQCVALRLHTIWLSVNKKNPSVDAYKKIGFEIARSACTDIGNGYVMDDHVMEYVVTPQ